jgi:cellulose synthase/poly-beta-1,6-N-acetylglucosamine synthase-like glycosyltransferase
VVGARLWTTTDPERTDAFGVGACNLVRREALERAGGFEWLRLDVADDAALAQLVAARGGRTMLASGVDLVSVRWQDSVRGMTRGFEKYGGSGGVGSIPAAITLASVATLGEVAPWLALVVAVLAGAPIPAVLAVATIVLSTISGILVARRAGAPRGFWLSGPVAPILVWWMQVRAAWLEHRRGGIVWRDTFYATTDLRAAKRYRLPGFGGSPTTSVTPDPPAR